MAKPPEGDHPGGSNNVRQTAPLRPVLKITANGFTMVYGPHIVMQRP